MIALQIWTKQKFTLCFLKNLHIKHTIEKCIFKNWTMSFIYNACIILWYYNIMYVYVYDSCYFKFIFEPIAAYHIVYVLNKAFNNKHDFGQLFSNLARFDLTCIISRHSQCVPCRMSEGLPKPSHLRRLIGYYS